MTRINTLPILIMFLNTMCFFAPTAHSSVKSDEKKSDIKKTAFHFENHWWQPSGSVNSLLVDEQNDLVYIGGWFSHVGPNIPYAALFDIGNDQPVATFPKANDHVRATVSDGKGGWYIAGRFSLVGDSLRNRLAHIDLNGQVTSWNPGASGDISKMILIDETLYIAGFFTTIGGLARNRIAAVHAVSGETTEWNPDINDLVRDMVIVDSTVYIGGIFTMAGGETRNRLASINLHTGNVNPWNPDANAPVEAMAYYDNTLYVGGSFLSIGGQQRTRLASFNLESGDLTGWNPSAANTVYSILATEQRLYAGGHFTEIGGKPRNRIASFDRNSGVLDDWNPDADGSVRAIVQVGNIVYLAGGFDMIGGVERGSIAAIDEETGNATPWNPNIRQLVFFLSAADNQILAGGQFIVVGGEARNGFAALDMKTGQLTSFDPELDGPSANVEAILVSNDTLFIGGHFTSAGGVTRNRFAAFETNTGTLLSMNPNFNLYVSAFAKSGNTLYVGGHFNNVNGQTRNRLAAIDTRTGQLKPWNPNANERVNSMVLSGNNLYIGGQFTILGGQPRSYLASVHTETAAINSWNPSPNQRVMQLLSAGDTLFAGGYFDQIGGVERKSLAAIDANTAHILPWNPGINNVSVIDFVGALDIFSSTLFFGGRFDLVKDIERKYIAGISLTDESLVEWNPKPSGAIRNISFTEEKAFITGNFRDISGKARSHFAVYRMQQACPELSLDIPESMTIPGCTPESDIQLAYEAWITEAAFAGGCEPAMSVSTPEIPWPFTGTLTNTWTLTDSDSTTISAAANFTITPLPEVLCNDDMVVRDSDAPFVLHGATPEGGIYSGNGVQGTLFDPAAAGTGDHIITYTYQDSDDCMASCTFNILIVETPVLDCIQDMEVCGNIEPFLIPQPSIADGTYTGEGVSDGYFDPGALSPGTYLLSYTWSDPFGFTYSCTFTITVTTSSPEVIGRNVSVYLDQHGQATITPEMIDNGSHDDCSELELSLDKTEFHCQDLGENTVMLTATNSFGISAQAGFQVTVSDTIVPVAIIKNITLYVDQNETIEISPEDIDDGSYDNCGIALITLDQVAFNSSHEGDNLVHLTVTDLSGNATTTQAIVTVMQTTASSNLNSFSHLKTYPNPFSQQITIEYVVMEDARTSLEIFNLQGAHVELLFDEQTYKGQLITISYTPSVIGQQTMPLPVSGISAGTGGRNNVGPEILIYRLINGSSLFTGRLLYMP